MNLANNKGWSSCFFILCQFSVVAMAIGLIYLTTEAKQLAQLDLSNLQQVVEDWSKAPFVEVKAFQTPCEGEWESVWERRWGGMEEGC